MIALYAVPVELPVPGGATNAYVLGDDERLLVDPAARTSALDDAAESIDHVAVTHTHPDHVDAVADYAAEADATVWAHASFAERFADATGVEPDRLFHPGDTIADTGVSVLTTPGHAPDHVAFVADGEAVTGDLVFADGSVFVGTPDGDVRTYLASLRRLLARDFDTLYPGHGDPIENPDERIRETYFHRRDRERSVRAAVDSGAETVDEILDAAYEKALGDARSLAAKVVRAHLQKLAVEGHVEWDGDRASLPAGQ
ncbi:MBL fold metallo-hydrolase [Halobacterium noricense]|uniref:MBL fold metallo-hydrolase n=1 Tax=Halobacterium noricense TaxID=223182 RepID=UPI001E51482D|nr:MBL fold metallo-hydrolase [Halobacterium noricense]UHH25764.1 MBL fold metallo-hydrolase [Halobacterium noricense]